MSKEIKLHIVHGLPGSGKTTYLNDTLKTLYPSMHICDLDKFTGDVVLQASKALHSVNPHTITDIAFDGLFSAEDICRIILVTSNFLNGKLEDIKLHTIVYHFYEDREQCVKNDIKRGRDQLSTSTIRTMKFESAEELDYVIDNYLNYSIYIDAHEYGFNANKTLANIALTYKIQCMSVYAGNDESDNAEDVAATYGDTIYSDKWCTGGVTGDCWGNTHAATTDDTPKYFAELVDYLDKLHPGCMLSDYAYIMDHLVWIENDTQYEYYGSYYYYNRYGCKTAEIENYLNSK